MVLELPTCSSLYGACRKFCQVFVLGLGHEGSLLLQASSGNSEAKRDHLKARLPTVFIKTQDQDLTAALISVPYHVSLPSNLVCGIKPILN